MKTILFLDDDAVRHGLFSKSLIGKAAYSVSPTIDVKTTIEALEKSVADKIPFDVAFLDHDLGGRQMVSEREGTGTIVAEYIAAMPNEFKPKIAVIHSFNPEGAQRMARILVDAGIRCAKIPFGSSMFYSVLP